jgi:hypothetical protein
MARRVRAAGTPRGPRRPRVRALDTRQDGAERGGDSGTRADDDGAS